MTNLAVLPGEAGRISLIEYAAAPPPSRGEARVRMLRAPINPADLLAIDGNYSVALARDAVLGAEGLGEIEAVGADVHDLAPGDPVLVLARGNWCRYRTVARAQLIALPAGIDPAQAAMLRINPPTAKLLLEAAGAGPGEVIVQNAATSAVAAWVRAIAGGMGVTIIDVVRRADPDLPNAIVDGEDLAEQVAAAAGGRPVRAALDCVAGGATGRMAQCLTPGLAPGGRVIVFGHLSGEPLCVRSQLLTGGGLAIAGFSLRPAEAALGEERVRAMFAELIGLFRRAPPVLPVREVIPLSRADAAIALARTGGRRRVLLDLTA